MNTHVLLWSQRQNALHIESVNCMLKNNMCAYRDNKATDYVVLLFGSKDECRSTADAVRGTLAARARESLTA